MPYFISRNWYLQIQIWSSPCSSPLIGLEKGGGGKITCMAIWQGTHSDALCPQAVLKQLARVPNPWKALMYDKDRQVGPKQPVSMVNDCQLPLRNLIEIRVNRCLTVQTVDVSNKVYQA